MQVPAVWAERAAANSSNNKTACTCFVDLEDNLLSGVFPREWFKIRNEISTLSLGGNAGLRGCVPLGAGRGSGTVTFDNTGISGLCNVNAAEVEAQQVQAVRAHLVPLLGAGSNQAFNATLANLVSQLKGLKDIIEPGRTSADIKVEHNDQNTHYADITIGVNAIQGVTYITSIEIDNFDRGDAVVGFNLTHLVPLAHGLPQLEIFDCFRCDANAEPGPHDLQLPTQLAQAAPYLKALRLTGCGLRGSLPGTWGGWASLEDLRLGALRASYGFLSLNYLTGSIPASYANMAKLKYLDLRKNQQLTGTLPPEFGSAGKMPIGARFYLGDTGLHGSLPLSWSHFSLGRVDLSNTSNISLNCTPDGLSVVQNRYRGRPCSESRPDINALVALQTLINMTGGVSDALATWDGNNRGGAGGQQQRGKKLFPFHYSVPAGITSLYADL